MPKRPAAPAGAGATKEKKTMGKPRMDKEKSSKKPGKEKPGKEKPGKEKPGKEKQSYLTYVSRGEGYVSRGEGLFFSQLPEGGPPEKQQTTLKFEPIRAVPSSSEDEAEERVKPRYMAGTAGSKKEDKAKSTKGAKTEKADASMRSDSDAELYAPPSPAPARAESEDEVMAGTKEAEEKAAKAKVEEVEEADKDYGSSSSRKGIRDAAGKRKYAKAKDSAASASDDERALKEGQSSFLQRTLSKDESSSSTDERHSKMTDPPARAPSQTNKVSVPVNKEHRKREATSSSASDEEPTSKRPSRPRATHAGAGSPAAKAAKARFLAETAVPATKRKRKESKDTADEPASKTAKVHSPPEKPVLAVATKLEKGEDVLKRGPEPLEPKTTKADWPAERPAKTDLPPEKTVKQEQEENKDVTASMFEDEPALKHKSEDAAVASSDEEPVSKHIRKGKYPTAKADLAPKKTASSVEKASEKSKPASKRGFKPESKTAIAESLPEKTAKADLSLEKTGKQGWEESKDTAISASASDGKASSKRSLHLQNSEVNSALEKIAAPVAEAPEGSRDAAAPSSVVELASQSGQAGESESEAALASASEPESAGEGSELESDKNTKTRSTRKKWSKDLQTTLAGMKAKNEAYDDWPVGSPVPYAALVKTFTLVESTTKRLEKLQHTSRFLRQVLRLTPDELLLVVHLMINKLAADYEGIELGIGENLLMKAIGESCGRSVAMIKEHQKEIGDLGEVALKSRNIQRTLFPPKPLTVKSVHEGLKEIALTKGGGGQSRKVALIKKLLSAAKGEEAKYLVRGLEGKLRLGLAEKTVIVGLSQAMIAYDAEKQGKGPSLEQLTAAEQNLKTVYSELPNYDIIIPAMLKDGIMNLRDTCKLQPGVPLKPMLAKPTKAISEVLDRFENKTFTCEYKYDGERVQIHYVSPSAPDHFPTINPTDGLSAVFSRNSENLSSKYPDILAALPQWVGKDPEVTSFVLDCEAVAWDRVEKRVLPFQQLMTRKRKDVVAADVKVKVCVFAFDLLFLNGRPLVREPLEKRRQLLHTSFAPVEGEFAFATYTDGQELDTIATFLEDSVKASCEGLMVKMLTGSESGYEPSKRSRNWLKVKKDYLATSAADSLDLTVIGAYHGKGKRTAVYGAFLLACYNPSSQEFESICNIGTGFTDAVLVSIHKQLAELEIEKPKPYYAHAGAGPQQPDVWFDAKVVWEVKTADLSLSPKYKAAAGLMGESGKGISLRFPRFIRERDDKKPEDATRSSQVAEMYKMQEVVRSAMQGKKGAVDDNYEY